MTLKVVSVISYVFLDLESAKDNSQGSKSKRRARNDDVTPTTHIRQYIRGRGRLNLHFFRYNTMR